MSTELEPLDDLDVVYSLPENVADDLRSMYEVIVVRMRRDVQGLPVSTVQLLLIERIAYNYIVLRQREGAEGGFSHATAQKEFNQFWLAMAQEFHRQTRQVDPESKQQLITQVVSAFNAALSQEPDAEVRNRLRARLTTALSQAGL